MRSVKPSSPFQKSHHRFLGRRVRGIQKFKKVRARKEKATKLAPIISTGPLHRDSRQLSVSRQLTKLRAFLRLV